MMSLIVDDDKVIGRKLIDGVDVKERRDGETKLLVHCESERERVEAIKKYWGIELTVEEQHAIMGMKTVIK